MSIYNFDTDVFGEQLTPPAIRGTKHLAWLRVILWPIQRAWQIFRDYKDGSTYADYDNLATYSIGARVVYTDRRVYEYKIVPSLPIAGIPPTDTVYWQVVNENFIGAIERAKTSSQIIELEASLNKYFQNPLPANQIYLVNNLTASNFWLGFDGETSSKLVNDSIYASDYLANINAVTIYNFTVMVPSALFTALGSTNAIREGVIRNWVDRFKLAGITYNVVTY